jgi:hypothetical protein
MKQPDVFVEVFMSLIKWFLLFTLVNNAIWGLVHFGVFNGTSAEIVQAQDGTNNVQEMTNG